MKINPDAAGFDAKRLERITEHLQQRYVDAGKIAGCQVAVSRHGHVGYWRSLGAMDLEAGRPVEDDTIWRIYSMTKPITGVALLSLYERGMFQLDDPVHRFIPSWKRLKVEERQSDGSTRLVDPQRPMTVRDAMMHMTGFGMDAMQLRLGGSGDAVSLLDGDLTLEEFCERLADVPLKFHPGTRWLYSISTDICGRLVEVISGMRFDEYLEQVLFGPLGMADTGFTVPDGSVERLASSYYRRPDKTLKLVESGHDSRYRTPRKFLSGGGGLVSTTSDYLRFCQMLVNGGELDGVRILSRKTIELMASNHLPGGGDLSEFAVPGGYGEVGFEGTGFGLTVAVGKGPVATQTASSAGEFMWGGYASTIFWVDPAEELTCVFMTQLIPSGTFDFRNQLKAIVYGAIVD